MEFFADWHTHSKLSDGRGTVEDNVRAALARGLAGIAVTDHGPANLGAGVKSIGTYRELMAQVREANARFPDIQVKAGAEANVLDVDGSIDLPLELIKELDILAVGLHPYIKPASWDGLWSVAGLNLAARVSRRARQRARVSNTKALKEVVHRFDVDFISHPDLRMPIDAGELAGACAARSTALEINTGHHYDKAQWVQKAAPTGVHFVVNSDAHFPAAVGELASGGLLLEKLGVPPERIINALPGSGGRRKGIPGELGKGAETAMRNGT